MLPKMRPFLINIFALSIFFITACNKSDYEIIAITQDENKIENTVIKLGINGPKELVFKTYFKYESMFFDSIQIKSSEIPVINLKKLNLFTTNINFLSLADSIVSERPIKIEIIATNKIEDILIKKSVEILIKSPPIVISKITQSENFLPTELILDVELNKSKSSLKTKILSEILRNHKYCPPIKTSKYDIPIINEADSFTIKLEVDKYYKKTFLWHVPAITNNMYSNHSIENYIKDVIEKFNDTIHNTHIIKSDTSDLISVYRKAECYHSGLNSIYLVTIDDDNQYFYHEIGNFIVDDIPPSFINQRSYNFSGDERWEGLLCLVNEHFYGHSPHKVPFVGIAYGDIKEIYVNNKRVNFTIGKEIYFKQSLYLDNGYNRIPIRVIDHKGNNTEYYIPVTLTPMDENKIIIEND